MQVARLLGFMIVLVGLSWMGASIQGADGLPIKAVLDAKQAGKNLLKPEAWTAYQDGFQRNDKVIVCDNATDVGAHRGAAQRGVLNQTKPEPIVASAWSKAENVSGSPDGNYSLYLDLVYVDGTSLWGQTAIFTTGTHDWERRQVVVFPDKPVKQLTCYVLLRQHGGKAWFHDVELSVVKTSDDTAMFDCLPIGRRHLALSYQVVAKVF